MNKYLGLLLTLFLGVGILLTGNTAKAESNLTSAEYITDIRIVNGDSSVESATESGWKVMAERIDGNMIAYRTGSGAGDALKNLCLLASDSSTETIDGITYSELGSIGGMTLFGTKDSSAGGAIVSIRMIDEPIIGDGTHTVRDKDGEVRELGSDRYLATSHAGDIGLYISDIDLITAGSKNSAIRKAANKGFDYYRLILDEEDKAEVIAFNRTDDEDKAVRGVYAVNKSGEDTEASEDRYKLYYSISPAAGAPIADIELKEITELLWDDDAALLGEWAKMPSGATDNFSWNPISVFEDKASLGQALKDHSQGNASTEIVVAQKQGATAGDGDIELAGVDMSTFLTKEDEEEPEDTEPEQTEDADDVSSDDQEVGASDEPVGETAYDEPGEDTQTESEEEETTDEGASEEGEEENVTGSMIGWGSIFTIIGGVVVFAALFVAAFFYRKRIKGGAKDEK